MLLAISSNLLFAQMENDLIVSKKEAREAKAEEQHKKLQNIVENKHFVLEADYLRDRYIARQPVSSMINFIKLILMLQPFRLALLQRQVQMELEV